MRRGGEDRFTGIQVGVIGKVFSPMGRIGGVWRQIVMVVLIRAHAGSWIRDCAAVDLPSGDWFLSEMKTDVIRSRQIGRIGSE